MHELQKVTLGKSEYKYIIPDLIFIIFSFLLGRFSHLYVQ